jgi:O-antigen/teichoic acid export membrane protein
VLGVMGACVGPAVGLIAPQYAPAIPTARLFLLSGAALGLVNLSAVGAVAAGRQALLPLYAAGALAVGLGLAAIGLALGLGLEGTAAASLVGHTLFAAAVLRLNAKLSDVLEPERLVARALRPLLWCVVAVTVAGHAAAALREDGAAVGIYLLLILPLLPRCLGEWRRVRGER